MNAATKVPRMTYHNLAIALAPSEINPKLSVTVLTIAALSAALGIQTTPFYSTES